MIISWRSFALSVLLCVVVGLSTLAEPLDMFVEAAIGRLGNRPVSGDIVVVALDERSLLMATGADFTPTLPAKVFDAVNDAGANRLSPDFHYTHTVKNRDFPQLHHPVTNIRQTPITKKA